jgi:Protein of unknown function (DUF3105)
VLVVALLIGIGLIISSHLASTRAAVAGPGQFFPSQGHCHIGQSCPRPAAEYETFAYNSDPPTSGPHVEQFLPTFFSDQPVPKKILVHLAEHGNVVILYNSDKVGVETVSFLRSQALFYDQVSENDPQALEEQGRAVIVAPYPQLKSMIALVAWTRLDTLDTDDYQRIDRFVHAWLGNQDNARQ